MKYIDAEKLMAILEARIEAGLDAYGGNLKWLLESIDFLQQEQPSLPSNLDEAVLAYEDSSEYPPANQEEDRMVYDAFKAGAEWMAGQGETIVGEVVKDINNNLAITAKGFSGREAVFGDKVIVQIRKKQ